MTKTIPSINKSEINVLFIHHSTGGNLLNQGRVRDEIRKRSSDIALWDHNYNLSFILPSIVSRLKFFHRTGLSGPDSKPTGVDYNINLNNDNPKDYERIFTSPSEEDVRKKILQFDVVIFKKCFPTSQIDSLAKFEDFKNSYLNMRNFIDKNPNKLFVIMTQPPLRSEVTNKENAMQARKLSDWLQSKEFLEDRKNLKVFDFFDLLASGRGSNKDMLKREYTSWFYRDSHPNGHANKVISPVFAKFIVNEIRDFKK